MRIYLIRHGETLWNTEGRLQGQKDIPLNENGIRLAKITAEKMSDIAFDFAISSPFSRAKETAKLILGERAVPIFEDERISEISFGVWEGLCCRKDNYEIPSEEFRNFFKNPFAYQPPKDAESIADVCVRTKDFWEELLKKSEWQDKTILIASHGCTSRGILHNLFEDKEDFWHGCVPPNCSVSIIDAEGGKAVLQELDKIYYSPDECKDFYGVKNK